MYREGSNRGSMSTCVGQTVSDGRVICAFRQASRGGRQRQRGGKQGGTEEGWQAGRLWLDESNKWLGLFRDGRGGGRKTGLRFEGLCAGLVWLVSRGRRRSQHGIACKAGGACPSGHGDNGLRSRHAPPLLLLLGGAAPARLCLPVRQPGVDGGGHVGGQGALGGQQGVQLAGGEVGVRLRRRQQASVLGRHKVQAAGGHQGAPRLCILDGGLQGSKGGGQGRW